MNLDSLQTVCKRYARGANTDASGIGRWRLTAGGGGLEQLEDDLTGGWRLTAGGGDLEQLEDDFKGCEPTAEFDFKWRA